MKTLEKLKLHNLHEIGAEEQSAMKGGESWYLGSGTIYGSDSISYDGGGLTNMLGEVTVYGGAVGMVQNATNELGVTECAGPCNNVRIQEYLGTCNGYNNSSPDSTPWCSAFVNFIALKSGYEGTNSATAASWLNWGSPTSNPKPGDVAIAPDGHHVGIVESVEGGVINIISGNYSNQVSGSECSSYSFRTGG